MKMYNLPEILRSPEILSCLPCEASFLGRLVNEFGKPDRTNASQYQVEAITTGTFTIESPTSRSLRLKVQGSAILASKALGYEFHDNGSKVYLFFSDISRGFPISAVYFEEDQVCVTLTDSVWAVSEDEIKRLVTILRNQRDASVESAREVYAVTGDDNFAHHLWNQLGIINSLCITSLAQKQMTVIATAEPLGPLPDLFPEMEHWRWMRMSAENLEAFNASNRLFVVLAGTLITHGIQARIKEYASANMNNEAKWLASILKRDKSLWLSVRECDRTITNQVQVLSQICIKFLQNTKLHIVIDGFSVTGDVNSIAFKSKKEYDSRVSADHVVALELIREISNHTGPEFVKRIHVIVGWHVLDVVSILDCVAFYFCHAGTLQHKISWFSDVCGVTHSNTAVLENKPGLWTAQQVENGSASVTLPLRFVRDVALTKESNARTKSLQLGSYEILDLEDLSAYLLDTYRSNPTQQLAIGRTVSTVVRFSMLTVINYPHKTGQIYYLDLGAITCFFSVSDDGRLEGPWPSMTAIEQALTECKWNTATTVPGFVPSVQKASVSLLTAFSSTSASVQHVEGSADSYEIFRVSLSLTAVFFVVTGPRGVLKKTFSALSLAKTCVSNEAAQDRNWRKFDVHTMSNRRLLPIRNVIARP